MRNERRVPPPRNARTIQLYGMRKSELVKVLADLKTSHGLRLIYGTPYTRWTKDEIISEILRMEFPQ